MRSATFLGCAGLAFLCLGGVALSSAQPLNQVCTNYVKSNKCVTPAGCSAVSSATCLNDSNQSKNYNAIDFKVYLLGRCVQQNPGTGCDDTKPKDACTTDYYWSPTNPPSCTDASSVGCKQLVTQDVGC